MRRIKLYVSNDYNYFFSKTKCSLIILLNFFCLILKGNIKFLYKNFHINRKEREKKKSLCSLQNNKTLTKKLHITPNLFHEKLRNR